MYYTMSLHSFLEIGREYSKYLFETLKPDVGVY